MTKTIARFVPQAWIRNYAVEIDPRGNAEWDCPVAFDSLAPDYRAALIAEMDEEREALDVNDALRDDPDAPEWVRAHNGPFSIWVRKGC